MQLCWLLRPQVLLSEIWNNDLTSATPQPAEKLNQQINICEALRMCNQASHRGGGMQQKSNIGRSAGQGACQKAEQGAAPRVPCGRQVTDAGLGRMQWQTQEL